MLPQSEKSKKTTKILVIILAVVALIVLGFVLTPVILGVTVYEYRTISGIPEPEQTSVDAGMFRMHGETWWASAEYKAKYRIEGLVVGVEDYTGASLYDRISPRDVSLAWGDMAAHNNLIQWQRGHREMNADVSLLAEWVIGKSAKELFVQFSNNHLIANDEVKDKIAAIKRGDHVILEGFLVDVMVHESSNEDAYYELNSSLVRDDEGDEACEVMYVTSVEWLD